MPGTLIKGGYVVTVDPSRRVFPNGFVTIEGSKIAGVGAYEDTPVSTGFDRVVDASGMIVVPGLINVHQHFYYHLFKGLANGLLLEDWFPTVVFPVLRHLTDDDMELTAYLAGIEMLMSGTTCCLHHLRTTTTDEILRRISGPTTELGFRQVIGKEVQCRLAGNPRHPRDLAEEIAYVEEMIPRWHYRDDGLVRLCLVAECGSVFVEQKITSEELLVESKRLADRHGLKVAAHISGGTLSFDKSYLQVLRKSGRTDTQLLMQLGLLDSSWILAHGINCTDTDLRLMADAGASLVYTPTSEAARGGGIGPIAPALAAGVNVALGSDGPMVDYSVDMVEQMKMCGLLQRVKHLDPTVLPAETCLEMATINAARALGLDAEIGSLEIGKLADIAIFDLCTPHAAPANNPISNFISSAHGTDVHTVFVNGREVVSDGVLKTFTGTRELIRAAGARAQEIIEKAGLEKRTQPDWPNAVRAIETSGEGS
jgi:5-methylthioadenosine/S-adenosylhomocysteine deaminase